MTRVELLVVMKAFNRNGTHSENPEISSGRSLKSDSHQILREYFLFDLTKHHNLIFYLGYFHVSHKNLKYPLSSIIVSTEEFPSSHNEINNVSLHPFFYQP